MNIKKYTNYILNKYQKEIIYDFYDNSGKRKNKIKDEAKLKKLISDTQELFQVSGLQTSLKIGTAFNYSDLPWIHIYNEKIVKLLKMNILASLSIKKTRQLKFGWDLVRPILRKKKLIKRKIILLIS